jgi:hypothetical protein
MGTRVIRFWLISLILAWVPTVALAEEWKGIVPTVATRSDVVRLFQKCEDRTMPCEFQLDGDQIRVVFSGTVQDDFYECSKALPPDTVLLVEVTPKLPFPLKNYEKRYHLKRLGKSSEFAGYFDERAGFVLKTKSNKVIQLNYVANSSDRPRCKDYYDNPAKFVGVVTHCPPVSLEGPTEAATAGEILKFKASVEPDPKMMLLWNVSGGKIVNRTGREMSLDTSGLDGQTLNVTIQASGSCTVESSMTVQIRPKVP